MSISTATPAWPWPLSKSRRRRSRSFAARSPASARRWRSAALDSPEEDLGHREERVVHGLQFRRGLGERDAEDLVAAQRRHLAPLLLRHHVGGVDAEARPQHAVECRGRAAALDVAEHGGPGLEAGLLLDHLGDLLPDAAQADMPELVELLVHLALAGAELGALGHHHDGEVHSAGPVPTEDVLAHLLDLDGLLRDEDHVGAARDARVGGYPAGV